jgi:hypothetical protein
VTDYTASTFEQFGGTVVVDEQLSIGSVYSFEAGSLEANTIVLAGRMTITSPGIVNSHRFILAGGKLEAYASCQLGRLELQTADNLPNVSELILHDSAVVHFRNSRNLNRWTPGAYLLIKNWRGSLNGEGATQLYVGNNKSGLSPAELERVVFEDPAGLPKGDYSARILTTGEVVPSEEVASGF